jgi:hypothetical protein
MWGKSPTSSKVMPPASPTSQKSETGHVHFSVSDSRSSSSAPAFEMTTLDPLGTMSMDSTTSLDAAAIASERATRATPSPRPPSPPQRFGEPARGGGGGALQLGERVERRVQLKTVLRSVEEYHGVRALTRFALRFGIFGLVVCVGPAVVGETAIPRAVVVRRDAWRATAGGGGGGGGVIRAVVVRGGVASEVRMISRVVVRGGASPDD